ncbi:hypothetical protein AB9L13_11235 [Desulfovibrio piger]
MAGSLALGLILGQRPGGGVVPRWPDHGQRTPGAAATAPDQGTGRAVRQGEGVAVLAGIMAVACCMDQDREF